MRTAFFLLLVLTNLILITSPVQAETARFGISAGYGGWSGSDFSEFDAGWTAGLEALFTIGHRLFIGPAFDFSFYKAGEFSNSVNQYDLDVVMRYYLPSEQRLVFLGALAGWTHQSISESYLSFGTSGVAFGAMVGLSLPLGSISADLSLGVDYRLYGEGKLGAETIEGSNRSGARALLRLGLGFPWGLVED